MKLFTTTLMALFLCAFTQINAQSIWQDFDALMSLSANDKGGGGTSTTPPTTGGGDGAGGNDNPIKIAIPSTGTMAMTKTILKWDAVGTKPYRVIVSQNRSQIFSATTNKNSMVVDFGSLALAEGKDYTIQVRDSEEKFKTNNILVQFKPESALKASLEELEKDPVYMNAEGVRKALMKAHYLDENGWKHAAMQAYDIPTDNREDMILVINMYNKFLGNL